MSLHTTAGELVEMVSRYMSAIEMNRLVDGYVYEAIPDPAIPPLELAEMDTPAPSIRSNTRIISEYDDNGELVHWIEREDE